MSYKKISDGYQTINVSNTLLTPTNPDSVKLRSIETTQKTEFEQPMTFGSCPECGSDLKFCNCLPENYYCMKCGWEHITHSHEKVPLHSGGYGNVHQNSMLSKAIRK